MAYIIRYTEPGQFEMGFDMTIHHDGDDGLLYTYLIDKEMQLNIFARDCLCGSGNSR